MGDLLAKWRPAPCVDVAGDLVLRAWTAADAAELTDAVVASLSELLPWMQWAEREPLSLPDRRQLLDEWAHEWRLARLFNYAVLSDGRIAGSAGLMSRSGPAALEIGYWTRSDLAGRGIATAAARALTDLACSLPHIARVEIHHDKANVPSGRIPAKLGYELVEEYEREAEARNESGTFMRWIVRSAEWLA